MSSTLGERGYVNEGLYYIREEKLIKQFLKKHKKERGDFDALRERRSEENGLDYTAYE